MSKNPLIAQDESDGARRVFSKKEKEWAAEIIKRTRSGETSTLEAFFRKNHGFTPAMIREITGESLVCAAAMSGNIETVKYVVDVLGAPPDDPGLGGNRALMYAAHFGFMDVAAFLLDSGADIEACNDDGTTALMAAAKNSLRMTEFMVSRGARVNTRNRSGGGALIHAAGFGTPETVEFLLDNGAREQVNEYDDEWKYFSDRYSAKTTEEMKKAHKSCSVPDTPAFAYISKKFTDDFIKMCKQLWAYSPLMAAAKNGRTGNVKVLVQKGGADPNLRRNGRYDMTAFDVALAEISGAEIDHGSPVFSGFENAAFLWDSMSEETRSDCVGRFDGWNPGVNKHSRVLAIFSALDLGGDAREKACEFFNAMCEKRPKVGVAAAVEISCSDVLHDKTFLDEKSLAQLLERESEDAAELFFGHVFEWTKRISEKKKPKLVEPSPCGILRTAKLVFENCSGHIVFKTPEERLEKAERMTEIALRALRACSSEETTALAGKFVEAMFAWKVFDENTGLESRIVSDFLYDLSSRVAAESEDHVENTFGEVCL